MGVDNVELLAADDDGSEEFESYDEVDSEVGQAELPEDSFDADAANFDAEGDDHE